MMAGKVTVVAGYGDVGKGSGIFKRSRGSCYCNRIDPICALQAAMDGFEVKKMNNACKEGYHCDNYRKQRYYSGTPFEMMKDKTIVCNIGH